MPGLQFKIELNQSEPRVWRRIVVPYNYTFYKFHLAIQGAFGWENYHLFQFLESGFLDKVSYAELNEESNQDSEYVTKDAKRAKIKHIFLKIDEFLYIYDLGDKWEHSIKFEKIVEEDIERPFCIEGGGNCPPEDSGGIRGYARIIESVNTPDHKDREEYAEWLGLRPGEKWDMESFNVKEANKRLCLLA